MESNVLEQCVSSMWYFLLRGALYAEVFPECINEELSLFVQYLNQEIKAENIHPVAHRVITHELAEGGYKEKYPDMANRIGNYLVQSLDYEKDDCKELMAYIRKIAE